MLFGVLLGSTVHAADLNTQLARIMRSRSGTAVVVDDDRCKAAEHGEIVQVQTRIAAIDSRQLLCPAEREVWIDSRNVGSASISPIDGRGIPAP